MYACCERPLVYEVDRLQRICRDERIEFCIFDSVAFACDGPPEAAEIAARYFRAVRGTGGSLLRDNVLSGGYRSRSSHQQVPPGWLIHFASLILIRLPHNAHARGNQACRNSNMLISAGCLLRSLLHLAQRIMTPP